MKALRKLRHGEDGLKILTDFAMPVPAAGEVLIKIHYAGICGTDLHIMHDEFKVIPPVTIGHEFSGVVEACGEGADEFAPGDKVVAMTAAGFCGHCTYCQQGLYMLCDKKKALGSGKDGAFAEYMTMPADRMFKLPDNIPLLDAALCEPLACAVRGAVEIAHVKPGDYVYVSGPGIIGQLVAQLANIAGGHVTVAGTSQDAKRLELALELGADEVIDVMRDDVLACARENTNGSLYDVVFECSGAARAADTCLDVVRKTGHYQQVGLFGKPISFDMDKALLKEVNIANSYASERTSWIIALRLLKQGRLQLKPLVSAVLPLEEWRKGFSMAEDKEGYKIILCMD